MKYLLLALIFPFLSAFAQTDSLKTEKKEKKVKIAGLALPGIDPEYGFYVQGGAVGLFKTTKDSNTRTSNLYLFGLYSQYNQWRLSLGGDVFTNDEKYYFNAWYYVSHLPDLFFGIGNNTNAQNFEFVDYDIIYANTNAYRKIKKGFFVGLGQFYENVFALDYSKSKLFQEEINKRWIGEEGYEAFGIGPKLRWDSRNNIYSPFKGCFLEIGFYQYWITGKIKSQHQRIFFDARKYYSIDNDSKNVLAFQFFAEQVNSNEVPFALIPSVNTRAYHPNLHKTNAVSHFQTEFRKRVWKGLGFSVFGGLANASNNMFETDENSLKPNLGLGVRYRIIKKDNLNVRLEYGIGKYSSNIYLAFYDAF
ncbi:MAG: hypothetical protein SNJ77_02150 [Cytophagales bacterium]